MVKLKRKDNLVILTLQPNRSANWRQNKIVIFAITGFVMFISIIWSLIGAWLILPFAGIEVGLLAFLMYRASYSSYQKQIITIGCEQVLFEAGVYYPKCCYAFSKNNLSVYTTEANTEFEQTQISLQDGQQTIHVGQFLNQSDRITALSHFKKANLHIHSDKWWKTT